MLLTWRGDDAYDADSCGRVGTVSKWRDHVPEGIPPFSKPFWHAFLLDEYVLVDDEPGTWPTRADAMTAVETAYVEYLESGGEPPPPASPPGPQVGHMRSLLRAWRRDRRRRREE